jgi:hypothetical protein
VKQESIDEARKIVIERISQSNLDQIDKVELLINLHLFFDKYNENIKVLKKHYL